MDDGADVIGVLHRKRRELLPDILGGTEETTTGVIRLHAMERDGELGFPIVAVNEATPSICSTIGTAPASRPSTASFAPPTSCLPAAASWSAGTAGAGGALPTGPGLGAHVTVIEVDALRALQAVMDGFRVMPIADAAVIGDIFVTATGDSTSSDASISRL